MIKKQTKVLGHEVSYNVPENSAEFNALAPNRKDAACEEGTNNIVYRGMNPETRDVFLHGSPAVEAKDGAEAKPAIVGVEEMVKEMTKDLILEAGDSFERKTVELKDKTGAVRTKDGEALTKYDETEDDYYKRLLALLVKYKLFGTLDAARAHFDPLIKSIAESVPFDPSETIRAPRGPVKLPAKYKIAAAKSLAKGTVSTANDKMLSKINKSFTPTNDTSKLFTGKFPDKDASGAEVMVDFSVSEADAEAYGKLLKEYFDWKASQEMNDFTA